VEAIDKSKDHSRNKKLRKSSSRMVIDNAHKRWDIDNQSFACNSINSDENSGSF
jgi:hypothetical protein